MSSLIALAAYATAIAASPPSGLAAHAVTPAGQGRPEVIVAHREQPGAAMIIEFDVGAMDDRGRSGLTHLAQFVLLDANRRWPSADRVRTLYGADAELAVTTGQVKCSFILTGVAPDFDGVAERLLRQLLAPQIDPKGFKEALRRMQHHDGGSDGMDVAAQVGVAARPSYGFSRQPNGDRGAIADITFEQVDAHIKRHLRPANATVILTGGVAKARLLNAARSFRGGERRSGVTELKNIGGRYRSWSGLNYRLVGLGAPLGTAEQSAEMQLFAVVLGERVQDHFRSAGTSYSTGVGAVRRPWAPLVLVEVPTFGVPASAVAKELDRLIEGTTSEESMSEQDFEKYRGHMLHRFRDIDESPLGLAMQLAMGRGGTPWFDPQTIEAVRTMKVETFRSHVRAWADPQRAAHVVLSPSVSRSL